MARPDPIRIDTDTWIVMREPKDHPVAIIQRITDTSGEARYLVMVWQVNPMARRMSGIYRSLREADDSVKYDLAPVMAVQRKNAGPPNGRYAEPNTNGRHA